MAQKIRPMPGWVAVGGLPRLDKSEGGLYLPREQWNYEQSWQRGEVLSVGNGATKVRPGDIVAIAWSRHRKLTPTMRLVKEKAILGVFE